MKSTHLLRLSQSRRQKSREWATMGAAFLGSTLVLSTILVLYGFAPFGHNSLASMDARIQYLDFFAYLRDWLEGKNSLLYTFSKTLGGTYEGVFAYYLSSPLNIFVAFFPKEQLNSFFDILVVIKIGLSAACCAFFLIHRFERKLRPFFVVLLAVSYALMQYNIAQSSNIMWLDGVYMLPLILYGVYASTRGKGFVFLAIAVGMSILFNWYSAAINCLFAVGWFFFEWCYANQRGELNRNEFFRSAIGFALSLLAGVMLSAVLFVPALIAMASGENVHGAALSFAFRANPLAIFQNFTLGSESSSASTSLFVGSFALLGCFAFFFDRMITQKSKAICAVLLFMVLMLFSWEPFYFLFSLMRRVGSYWCRFSYVGIFAVVFVSANFWVNKTGSAEKRRAIGWSAFVISVFLLLADMFASKYNLDATLGTVLFLLGIGWMMTKAIPHSPVKWKSQLASLCLALLIAAEMGLNAKLLIEQTYAKDVEAFQKYTVEEEAQIKSLKAYDPSFYRISQTKARRGSKGLHAQYNEAAAYGYASISGYTSVPDVNQLTFLDKVGYRSNGDYMCIVNTSILPVDALLDVRYVLSPKALPGLVKVKTLPTQNGKSVYTNPYCLPFGFVYSGTKAEPELPSDNPFEAQNAIYEQLLGHPVSLYTPVSYEETRSKTSASFALDVPANAAIYGNFHWQGNLDGDLYLNGKFETQYGKWLSPSVFVVPPDQKTGKPTVRLDAPSLDETLVKAEFYTLDLNAFQAATQPLQDRAAVELQVRNGYVKCIAIAEKGERLCLSIPYDPGWVVRVNGMEKSVGLVGGMLYSLPLDEGSNEIEMIYHLRGLKEGIILSCLALVALGCFHIFARQKRKSTLKHHSSSVNV